MLFLLFSSFSSACVCSKLNISFTLTNERIVSRSKHTNPLNRRNKRIRKYFTHDTTVHCLKNIKEQNPDAYDFHADANSFKIRDNTTKPLPLSSPLIKFHSRALKGDRRKKEFTTAMAQFFLAFMFTISADNYKSKLLSPCVGEAISAHKSFVPLIFLQFVY